MKFPFIAFISAFYGCCCFEAADAALNPGDIAIIGLNADDPDSFAFVALVDIPVNEEIKFTDNGWIASTKSFRSGEGILTWTGGASKGTVVSATNMAGGGFTATGSFAFSASGDQLIAYQGDELLPTFLYALNLEGNPGQWQNEATSARNSALPGDLDAMTAPACDEIDNIAYAGPTSGTKAELLAAISDCSNWEGSDSLRQTFLSSFTVIPACQATVVINEVDSDNLGTDALEFIELYGDANCELDGLSVILFDGSGDQSYDSIDLDGQSTDAEGFFVIGSNAVANVELAAFSTNGVQNGADAIALYRGDFPDSTSVADIVLENLLDAIVYDTNDSNDVDLLTELGQSTQFNEDENGAKDTQSLSRVPDGTGGFVAITPTPGAPNDPPRLSISDASVEEGSGPMMFTVTRSGDTSTYVTVQYSTEDDTAEAGVDYIQANSAPLVFAADESTQTIEIAIVDEAATESNEQFLVVLSDPVGATIENDTATGTILDNDVPTCQATVVINEVDSDTSEVDELEFIELYGPANCELRGLIVILFNGNNDQSYRSIDLDGQSTDDAGFFVIGSDTGENVDLEAFTMNGIQNGADAVVLYRGVVSDFPDNTQVADVMAANIIDAIVYGTNDPVDSELFFNLGETMQFNEDENGATETQSLSRVPDGLGDFVARTPTPGAPNDPPLFSINDAAALESAGTMTFTVTRSGDTSAAVNVGYMTGDDTAVAGTDYETASGTLTFDVGESTQTFSVTINDNVVDADSNLQLVVTLSSPSDGFLEDASGTGTIIDDEGVVLIHDIQSDGVASPLVGVTVSIEGIVTGVFEHLEGFFVQEEDIDADTDDSTSEGIFVFLNAIPTVAVGDKVAVVGEVFEFNGLTELNDVTNVAVASSGNTLPSNVVISDASSFNLETVEGMLVSFAEKLVVTDTADFGRFGELKLSLERLYQATQLNPPGALDPNPPGVVITLDDGSRQQYPDPISYAPSFGATDTIRSGFCINPNDLTGIAHYTFGAYKLEPTEDVTFDASTNLRPSAPDDVGGTLKVASFNVANYFTTIDSGDICGPNTAQECQGADSEEELTRQKNKIVQAIVTLDADIVGLVEIENLAGSTAVRSLVDAINVVAGAAIYNFVDTGIIGTSAVAVGLIFKPDKATALNMFRVLDSSVDARFDENNTPTLAQSFTETTTSEVITVAVNHFKDQEGNCAVTRANAALALADWLATDPTTSGSDNFLIIGDLNAYAKEEATTNLLGNGFVDLAQQYIGQGAYNSGSNGFWGTLSYALASTSLLPHVSSATIWHINADEPGALDYNLENKSAGQETGFYDADEFRSSDRDPIILGLRLGETKTCQAASTARNRALQAIASQPPADDISRGTGYLRARTLQRECEPGYEYNPESRMCIDLDECATDYPCPGPVDGVTSSFCVDYDPPRRWKCGCLPGFEAILAADNNDFEQPVPTTWRPLQCLNRNECETMSPCHPNATCTDTIGGFECVCEVGLEGDGITCVEPGSPAPEVVQDDCQNSCRTDENQVCSPSKVTNGTFACLCEPGFSQIREGSRCNDDDECSAGTHDCADKTGLCDNIPGSFRCECLPGFLGGGRSCSATASPTPAPVTTNTIVSEAPVVAVSSGGGSSGGVGGPSLKRLGEVCSISAECASDNCVF